jgi:hypothetical protein
MLLALLEKAHGLGCALTARLVGNGDGFSIKTRDHRKPLVGEALDDHRPRDADRAQNNGDGPLYSIEAARLDAEWSTANEDD